MLYLVSYQPNRVYQLAFVFISDNPCLCWLRPRVKGVFRISTIKAMGDISGEKFNVML